MPENRDLERDRLQAGFFRGGKVGELELKALTAAALLRMQNEVNSAPDLAPSDRVAAALALYLAPPGWETMAVAELAALGHGCLRKESAGTLVDFYRIYCADDAAWLSSQMESEGKVQAALGRGPSPSSGPRPSPSDTPPANLTPFRG